MPSHTRREQNKRVSRKIRKLRGEGKPRKQAIAQAINTVSKRIKRK